VLEVLITGSVVYTGSEVVRDGYVYVKGGRVVAVGSGLPPEDYTFAHLILGGEGRVVAPSLTAIVDAPAYPWRFNVRGLGARVGLYRRLTQEEAFAASLPAVYEAHVHGVGRVVIEYSGAGLPGELAARVGGFYSLAYPACLGEAPSSPFGVVTVAGEGCGGDATVAYSGGSARAGDGEVLALVGRAVYRPSGEGVEDASNRLRRLLGLAPASIKEGSQAEIVVYNAARPPGMFLDRADDPARLAYESGLRAETLLLGDTVLVDQGEHLYIAEKQFSDARSLALRGRR